MKKTVRQPMSVFWTPRFWPTWVGIGFLRAACFLPYRWQLGLGKAIGRLGHLIARERRAITRRNIELCFPELSSDQRNRMALEHFESLGASLMELALGRWASLNKIKRLCTLTGAEHVHRVLDEGHGVILLSAHFTTLEISGRMLKESIPPFDVVYRPFRNGLLTEFVASSRERSGRKTIDKNDIKSMIRSLRDGFAVWYAPDQSFRQKQSALIEFFGEPSMTNIATTSLAKLGKAVPVPFFPRRLPDGGYAIEILPPLDGVPSDDPVEDTRKYIAVLEEQIRKCPEQYYWVHRRFKERPAPLPDAYADLDSLK